VCWGTSFGQGRVLGGGRTDGCRSADQSREGEKGEMKKNQGNKTSKTNWERMGVIYQRTNCEEAVDDLSCYFDDGGGTLSTGEEKKRHKKGEKTVEFFGEKQGGKE